MEKILENLRILQEKLEPWKSYALPVVVAAAVLCFWVFGGDGEEIEKDRGIEVSKEEVSEGLDVQGASEAGDAMIYVDIGGEVELPGVYQVPAGTRLFQVIEQAGGLKESAAIDSINQAEPVLDGQKIMIGSLDAESPYYIGSSAPAESSEASSPSSGAVRMTEDGIIVNINEATLEELQAIPGVGPSTAQKIIDYRTENGRFQKPEDLKKISGIGEKTYENLKDSIET